ncbi:DUF2163 domain-containing protein [Methylobacterium brachiatum]|uniref:DUF2163 domain-containing protein n=1 Tax=Methylobacterium brachiatum TaxID=269660 RepID=UPI001FDED914|nr:DUF2163 domain-containing protein [Methylobacterium brachiatum]
MRTADSTLAAYLANLRAKADKPLLMADCYTFTLLSGLILTYTDADVPVALNGYTYLADTVLVDGLRYRCTTGLDVDQQRITVSARPTDTVGGVPFLVALREGVFDGCTIRRDRAFFTDWSAPPIGGVTLFTGRLSSVDQVGRTSATLTVASELTLLDIDLPRNVWQPTCNHTLYDTGCRLVRQAYASAGTAGAGATTTFIPWTGASDALTQGTVTFTSGGNNGVSATIKMADTSGLTLAYPLPTLPTAGDAFTAYLGCDHTLSTCRSKFANEANFRGFPFVPTPEAAF